MFFLLRASARVLSCGGSSLLSFACDDGGVPTDDQVATGAPSAGDGDGDGDPNEVACILITELRSDIQVIGDTYMVNSYNSVGDPLTFEHHSSREGRTQ